MEPYPSQQGQIGKKVRYQYDPEHRIFYKFHFGSIELTDIIQTWEEIINKTYIPKNTKRFILDYRKASLAISPQSTKEIASVYLKHANIFSSSKVALIMDNPNDVVFPILANEDQSIVNFKPFSTIEGAIAWVCR